MVEIIAHEIIFRDLKGSLSPVFQEPGVIGIRKKYLLAL
jgi:hypothetical protein